MDSPSLVFSIYIFSSPVHFPVKRSVVPAPILGISCNYGCFDVDELSKRFMEIGNFYDLIAQLKFRSLLYRLMRTDFGK